MSFRPSTHPEYRGLLSDAVIKCVAPHVETITLHFFLQGKTVFSSVIPELHDPQDEGTNTLQKCQKLPAQQHGIVSDTTRTCSNTSVTILTIACTHRILVKSDNHTTPSTATSAANQTTQHGTSYLQWPQHKTR